MGATTNEGKGNGSVFRVLPKIVNDVVKRDNIQGSIFEGYTSEIMLTTVDGTADAVHANGIVIKGGDGYPQAADGVDADGGSVSIIGGSANGNGEGGDINITAGSTGDGPDANAGDVTIRGGAADVADNSDAGDVNIFGGDGSLGTGDSDGGDVRIEGGAAGDNGQAGNIFIIAGPSGNGSGGDNAPIPGDVQIVAGSSMSSTDTNGGGIEIIAGNASNNGSGGDLWLYGGDSSGTEKGGDIYLEGGNNSGAGREGRIVMNSLPVMPVYANATARDAAAGTPTNGMFCYNTATGNIEVYVGGAWKSVDTSAIV